jgi:phage terminase small subunit
MRVEEIQSDAAAKAGVSIQWVLTRLMENYERAMQHEPVMGKDGSTGEFRYDGAVANRSLELIGKHLGMFKDKVEHSGNLALTNEQALRELE